MKYLYLVTALLYLGACQSSSNSEESKISEGKLPAIEALTQRYADLNRFNGMILVEENDSILFEKAFGMAHYEDSIAFGEETEFRIGRIGELLIRDIVRLAAENQLIDLEDPVQKYLPELEDTLSILDLLEHRSGYPTQVELSKGELEQNISVVQLVKRIEKGENDPQRGSVIDYELIIQVLENIYKTPFEQILSKYSSQNDLKATHRHRFTKNPALGYLYHNYQGNGMERQVAPSEDQDLFFQNQSIYSSVRDLLTFSQKHPEPLHMFGYTPQAGFSYGLLKVPEKNRTLIILSNYKHPVADEIAQGIQDILDGKEYQLPLLREVVSIDPQLISEYAGTYAMNETMRLQVQDQAGKLFVEFGGVPLQLYPQSENQFFMADRDAAMRFLRDSTGVVKQVELLDGFLKGNVIPKVE